MFRNIVQIDCSFRAWFAEWHTVETLCHWLHRAEVTKHRSSPTGLVKCYTFGPIAIDVAYDLAGEVMRWLNEDAPA